MSRPTTRISTSARARERAVADRRRFAIIASVVLVAIGIVIAVARMNTVPQTASNAPIKATLAVGQAAPPFAVSTTGGPFAIPAADRKPTLLEVFATWCPHCQRETVVLNHLSKSFAGKANLVAVSGSPYGMDEQAQAPETQADVAAFAQRFAVTYPVAFDPNLAVANAYLQGGFPTVVLIGADGKVQAIRSGEIPEPDLAAAMTASLAGKPVDPKMGLKA